MNILNNRTTRIVLSIAIAASLTSCFSSKKTATYIVPNAINTVNSVSLNELNLTRGDYEIINTLSSDATINARIGKNKAEIHEADEEFALFYKSVDGTGLALTSYFGVVRLGYLNNTYKRLDLDTFNPEDIAIKLASYRLINIAQQYGADGVIEPIISTKAEQIGDNLIFKTTVTAKAIKLNTKK